MKLKVRIMALISSLCMALGLAVVTVAPAQAATYMLGQSNLDSACAWVHGSNYKAKSIANNVLGWRCYYVFDQNNTSLYKSVDIQFYCDVKYPGTTAKWYTYSNKLDWRCTTD